MAFVNERNVIMINDNTGADNRHRYEKAASAEVMPGNVITEVTATVAVASDADPGNGAVAVADLKVYAAPVAGVPGDEQPFATGDLVRFFYAIPGDIVRIKNSGVAFSDDDTVDIVDGEAIVGLGTLKPFGLVLEAAADSDTHVVVRVL